MPEDPKPMLYRPLKNGEIRLLRPVKGASHLEFTFEHVELSRRPKFTAVSYAWGSDIKPSYVIIDSIVAPVTSNLGAALAYGSDHLRTSRLWIDVVCINQEDNAEKELQIRLMADLYVKATKIFIWLGVPAMEDDAHVAFAASQMRAFQKLLQSQLDSCHPRLLAIRHAWFPRMPIFNSVEEHMWQRFRTTSAFSEFQKQAPNLVTGLRHWISQEWWSRTWVRQEATVPESGFYSASILRGASLPASKIDFHFGQHVATWNGWNTIFIMLDLAAKELDLDWPLSDGLSVFFHGISDLHFMRSYGFSHDLLEVLEIFRHTSCKNSLDKVYAPLGLVPQALNFFAIDYRMSVLQLYLEVANYYIQSEGNSYSFLSFAPTISAERDDGWPSWLPDWRKQGPKHPLLRTKHIIEPENVNRIRSQYYDYSERLYNAGGTQKITVHSTPPTLLIPTLRCDSIQNVLHRKLDYLSLKDSVEYAMEYWDMMHESYFTGEDLQRVLIRTLLADVQLDGFRNAVARDPKVDLAALDGPVSQLSIAARRWRDLVEEQFYRTVRGRRLCKTLNGYVALVPETAALGDHVLVFVGAQTMYVARPLPDASDTFEYLGDAYVRGFMDGELVADAAAKGISATYIKLV